MTVLGEWTTVDKTDWGPGPWQDEPDKVYWIDPETDLDCLMVRHPRYGNWCGYVAVTEGHPSFEKGYDDVDVDVHGGLTFAGFCRESDDPATGICHVPQPGRADHVWWLGFDLNHAYDLAPGLAATTRRAHEVDYFGVFLGYERLITDYEAYRDRAYVEAEIRSLARQLARPEEAR